MSIKYLVMGEDTPRVNSKSIRDACEEIDKFMGTNNEETLVKLQKLCENFGDIGTITQDSLKGSRLISEARKNALSVRAQTRLT